MAKKKERTIDTSIFKEILKPYDDLYIELEKLYGKDIAEEIVNAKLQYDLRGLFYGEMIM